MNAPRDELYRITLYHSQDVFAMRRLGREIARLVGLDAQDQIRVAAALSEIGREMLSRDIPAGVAFTLDTTGLVVSMDAPPGTDLADSEAASLAARLVDGIDLDGADGRVELRKRLPAGRPRPSAAGVRGALAGLTPVNPADELREQNRELARTLEEVRRLNVELQETNQGVMAMYHQLSAELEETNRGVVALYAELDEKSKQLRDLSDTRNRFWTTVSHELRAPLNSIIGLVRLLRGPGGEPLAAEQTHQVELIGSSAETLLALVGELLDMAKAESGRLDPHPSLIDVVAVAERLRMTLHPTADFDGVELQVDVAPEVGEMFADEVMLIRILRNVLSNALKFTPRGEVRMTVDPDSTTGEVVFTVADTGIGIPEEEQDRVFTEFYQVAGPLQTKHKGTGLGLPYARRLAEAMGGTLELTSSPGEGTTVTVRLPHQMRPPEVRRVLIADDDAGFRAMATRMLAGFAERVSEAPDGVEALEMMTAEPPDVVLVDVLMPRLAGAALLARMAEDDRLRDVPAVVVTVVPEQAPSSHPVLTKQELRRDHLLEAIRAAIGGRHA